MSTASATEQNTITTSEQNTMNPPAQKARMEFVISGNTIFALLITIILGIIGHYYFTSASIQSVETELRSEMQSGFESLRNEIQALRTEMQNFFFYLLENNPEQTNTDPTESTQ